MIAATELPPLSRGDQNANPAGIGFGALIREDFATHDHDLFEQGLWAVAVHRFGNWRMGLRWKILRAPCTAVYWCLFRLVQCLGGITLPYTTRLGRRVRIWHHGGMVLHARSIGNDVHIRQNTTFGIVRRGQEREIPIIEDRADIGCGVCILGHVRVGHDSRIGANAVVLIDIPPWSVAVGVPARVVKALGPDPIETAEREARDLPMVELGEHG